MLKFIIQSFLGKSVIPFKLTRTFPFFLFPTAKEKCKTMDVKGKYQPIALKKDDKDETYQKIRSEIGVPHIKLKKTFSSFFLTRFFFILHQVTKKTILTFSGIWRELLNSSMTVRTTNSSTLRPPLKSLRKSSPTSWASRLKILRTTAWNSR